jgi:hypothetical protein
VLSQENVELVRNHFDATARDLRPEGAIHRGIEAMRQEMRAWFGTWCIGVVITVRGQLIVRQTLYREPHQALEAVGLAE